MTPLLLTVLLFWYRFRSYFRCMVDRCTGRVPPGPWALPLLGTIDIDRRHPEKTFRKWAATYGNIFSFYLGERFCVAASDIDTIRRLLKDRRFENRCHAGMIMHLDGQFNKSIIMGNGPVWKEHRRFSMAALRDFGFSKAGGEEHVQKEAAQLVAEFHGQEGRSFDPKYSISTSVANVISYMLFSDGFDSSDPRFRQYEETVAANIAELSSGTPLEIFPWLRFIYPFSAKFQRIQKRFAYCQRPMMELIQEHKQSFDPNSPRDYVDAFLCVQEEQNRNDSNEGSLGTYTDDQLMRNLGDLYVAGFETTTTFLRWALIYMILNPQVQEKLHREFDRVIGTSRSPTMADKLNMPYTEAVILETFRRSDFLPFAIPHCATEDVEFDGYIIPEGTEIWPLITYHYSNDSIWGDPEVFRPERFLDSNGQLVPSLVDEIQPYSIGRRACLGEPLAKMEVFILLTTIMQHFIVSSDTVPDTEPVQAFGTSNFRPTCKDSFHYVLSCSASASIIRNCRHSAGVTSQR